MELLYDCGRAVREFYPGLSTSCLQAYFGVIPFCPIGSNLRRQYDTLVSNSVRLIKGAVPSWGPCVQVLESHAQKPTSVTLSPRGDLVASGGRDSTVRFWDAKTGAALLVGVGHANVVSAVVFHPSGRQIFSASWDASIVAWDTTTGVALRMIGSEGAPLCSIACSGDGVMLAAGTYDGNIHVYETCHEGRLLFYLNDPRASEARSLVFSKDSKYLLTAFKSSYCFLWDLRTRTIAHTYRWQRSQVRDVALSRDQKLIAGGCWKTGTVALWSFEHREETDPAYVLQCQAMKDPRVEFSPQADLLAIAGADGGGIQLWAVSATRGQHLCSLSVDTSPTRSLVFSPDGTHLYTAGDDEVIRLWDVEPYTRLDLPDAKAKVDILDHRNISDRVDHNSLYCLATDCRANDERASINPTIHPRLSAMDGDVHTTSSARHDGTIRMLEFSPNGQILASGADDGMIKLWCTQSGQLLRHWATKPDIGRADDEERAAVLWGKFCPDGCMITSINLGDPLIYLWDTQTGRLLVALEGHDEEVGEVAILRNGSGLISGGMDRTLRWWRPTGAVLAELETRESQQPLDSHASYCTAILDSHWHCEVLYTSTAQIYTVTVSNSGTLVAFGGADAVFILNLQTRQIVWQELHRYRGTCISSLVFSGEDRELAIERGQGDLDIWSTSVLKTTPRMPPIASHSGLNHCDLVHSCRLKEEANHVAFSDDNAQHIVSDSCIIPLPLAPTSRSSRALTSESHNVLRRFPQTAYLLSGWLWKTPASGTTPERICRIPPRYVPGSPTEGEAKSLAIYGNLVAAGSGDGNVAIIDLAQALPH